MSDSARVRILFVCMGNICRSPTAHAVFERLIEAEGLADRVEVDSAGTHAYHVGEAPDPRARETAQRRGLSMDHLRARKVTPADLETFDLVVAMDQANLDELAQICPSGHEEKLTLFMRFAPHFGRDEVPDPYYGGPNGFELVFDMVEEASRGLLEHLRRQYGI